jgi:hypothetical protein
MDSRSAFFLSILILFAFGLALSLAQERKPSADSVAATEIIGENSTFPNIPNGETQRFAAQYGKLPLSFEVNRGQIDPRVKFLSRGSGYTMFVTPTEAVLALSKSGAQTDSVGLPQARLFQREKTITTALRIKLVGGNLHAQVTGMDELPGKSNYFIGDDPKKWRTNVPNYAKVKLQGVYPDIDLIYYGNQRQLEEDFVVTPGGDPKAITMEIKGAERVSIDAQDELVLASAAGEVHLRKPVVYQKAGGVRHEITARYRLTGQNRVGFELGKYDARQRLVIDPVLVYSTYLGGFDADGGAAIAVDSSGNAYVTGFTASTDFPGASSSPIQSTNGGRGESVDTFVAKLNAGGSALVYSTYLGGTGDDNGTAIAVDSSGNAYVTGFTTSTNFPGASSSPIQSTLAGFEDAFVAKLNAGGTALLYSAYLGGTGGSGGEGIAVDSSGNAYVTGETGSSDFPGASSSPIQSAFGGGPLDAFVSKLNATGSALVYSTYLGGTGDDNGTAIAVDSSGNAYVTGFTTSINFPAASSSPIQSVLAGNGDAFVVKINAAGSDLIYSTYLGGSGGALARGIALDSSRNAYVTGVTGSANFPGASSSPIQSTLGGSFDAFVAKVNAAGSALIYSTYLGGSGTDDGFGIAVDSSGNAYVTGVTGSANFPGASSSPIQSSLGSGFFFDAFVAKIASNVPFSSFTATLDILAGPPPSFDLNAAFTLGAGSNGINPLTETVTLQVGTYTVTIPAGSFRQLARGSKAGGYVFEGVIGGVTPEAQIVPLGNSRFQFKAEAQPVDLAALSNPVTVTITIGDDAGTSSVAADLR